MKNIDYSNQIKTEALLNEYKGNLFEFLVAQNLAVKSSIEVDFLINLPTDYKERLLIYEDFIRSHDPKLLIDLPQLARSTADQIWRYLEKSQIQFTQWSVIGKIIATNDNELWNETDIVGSFLNEYGEIKNKTFSLKLTKDHSYTNTKSAGVKSFLIKYFQAFSLKHGALLTTMQSELNQEVDDSFSRMGLKLYGIIDANFSGRFDSQWSNHFSELPGELPEELKIVVHENYNRIALKLLMFLNELKNIDSQMFFQSLYALCGFGHRDIVQVNCFHQDYKLKKVILKNHDDLFTVDGKSVISNFKILPLKDLSSSIEILWGEIALQIRVKPMNKFTTAAYKINCSIKVKS